MRKLLLSVLVLMILGGFSAFALGGSESAAGSTTTPVGQYPVQTNATLRYWVALDANTSANFVNMGLTHYGQALQRNTGIKVDFEHPPAGASTTVILEALNLMLAAGDDMPDIIEYNWVTLVGGPGKAISDGSITKLDDLINNYAPNLKALLRSNPQFDRWVKADDGSYYNFPFIRGHEKLLYSQGLMLRKDWLDDLSLRPPETVQDWYNVLVAFKDRKNAASPFTIVWSNRNRMFMPSFGFLREMYVGAVDKRVHFGQIEPGYRQWIETMAKWYQEGLIDKDIMSITTAIQNQKMTTGTSGATVASVGSGMGVWTDTARPDYPRYEIIAVQYPVLNRGDRLVYSIPNQPYSGQSGCAITEKSKNKEIAARFLDYGFTQAGHMLYNFGIEGQSYTMVNGRAIYTPMVMNGGPNNWPLSQSLSAYMRSPGSGPFIQNEGYIEQYYALPEQSQALANFILPGAVDTLLPPIIPTQEESREYATIMQEINTYVDEKTARWLLGTEPVTDATWNDYIATVRRMNIDRAIAIQNAALDRYNRR